MRLPATSQIDKRTACSSLKGRIRALLVVYYAQPHFEEFEWRTVDYSRTKISEVIENPSWKYGVRTLPGPHTAFSVTLPLLGFSRVLDCDCACTVDTLVQAFQPPHSANRHDAGCRGARPDRVAAVGTNGLAVRLRFSVAEKTDRTYAEQQEDGPGTLAQNWPPKTRGVECSPCKKGNAEG